MERPGNADLSITSVVDGIDYRFEEARLKSFSRFKWPLSFLSSEELAAAGLYYYGDDDNVRCFACGVTINHWDGDDKPMEMHQCKSSGRRCKFLLKLPCGNVPIGGADPETTLPVQRDSDRCDVYINRETGLKYMLNSAPDDELFEYNMLKRRLEIDITQNPFIGLIGPRYPKSPHFSSYESRLQTLQLLDKRSSRSNVISLEKLAHAGFFYDRDNDTMICYFCGVRLNQWERYDNPVIAHMTYDPYCNHIIQVYTRTLSKSSNTHPQSARSIPCEDSPNRNLTDAQPTNMTDPEKEEPAVDSSYVDYENRLRSFESWPVSFLKKEDMADAGLVYFNLEDEVYCYYCGLRLRGWTLKDNPMKKHLTKRPTCNFIKKRLSLIA